MLVLEHFPVVGRPGVERRGVFIAEMPINAEALLYIYKENALWAGD